MKENWTILRISDDKTHFYRSSKFMTIAIAIYNVNQNSRVIRIPYRFHFQQIDGTFFSEIIQIRNSYLPFACLRLATYITTIDAENGINCLPTLHWLPYPISLPIILHTNNTSPLHQIPHPWLCITWVNEEIFLSNFKLRQIDLMIADRHFFPYPYPDVIYHIKNESNCNYC